MPRKLGTEELLDPLVLEGLVGGQRVAAQPAQPTQLAQQAKVPQKRFGGPGISGLLADLAQVFSATDPKSWQHQLGGMVAMKATTDVFAKYTKNLEEIISGEAEPGTAMEGLTPLERQRITPEQRAVGMEAIVAGEKMRQARAGLEIEERRAGALEGYYEDIGGYYEFLQTKTPEERDRYVTTEVGAPGGMRQKIAYNLDTKESTVLGEPYAAGAAPAEGMPAGQRANLIRGLMRDSAQLAGGELQRTGVGKMIMLPDGSVDFRFTDPTTDKGVWENAKQRALTRMVTQHLRAGTIDETTANAILGVEEPAMTPGEAREYTPGKQYQPGEYFYIEGVLQQAITTETYRPAESGGK